MHLVLAPRPMPKSILIADDRESIRKFVRLWLEHRTSFRVCGEAYDGVDAINKAKELKPDLILLDFAMPEMNGVEAAFVLKGEMPDVPIILFTFYDTDTLTNSLASTAGIDVMLAKPDGIRHLVDTVQNLLGP
jgi:CheY-like chemotaxis protein